MVWKLYYNYEISLLISNLICTKVLFIYNTKAMLPIFKSWKIIALPVIILKNHQLIHLYHLALNLQLVQYTYSAKNKNKHFVNI